MTDTERLDALEAFVMHNGALLIHNGKYTAPGIAGLGFWPGLRDLRKALDGLAEAQQGEAEKAE